MIVDVMPVHNSAQSISPSQLNAWRESKKPHALFDVRDPVEIDDGHIFGMTALPRRQVEVRIGSLVPDISLPIVIYDEGGQRAAFTVQTFQELGWHEVYWLEGGLRAWQSMGYLLASGSNVPSKKFGEQIQMKYDVPSVQAGQLNEWLASDRRIALCDVRTPQEHEQACIPGAINLPSFDHALLAGELCQEHDAVVLHCAGRTRSIIATQTLRDLGFGNVFALENGTMGWRLAGLSVEQGSKRRKPIASKLSADQVQIRAAELAAVAGVRKLSAHSFQDLMTHRHKEGRAFYAFDVRNVEDYVAGHIPQTIAVPGGQLVQRTDDFITGQKLPVVLIDQIETRALLTATWLCRMGHDNVFVLEGGIDLWQAKCLPLDSGRGRDVPKGLSETRQYALHLNPVEFKLWLKSRPTSVLLDVGLSSIFRKGHLAGASWLPRTWLETRIDERVNSRHTPIALTCSQGAESSLAAWALRKLGFVDLAVLEGGTSAWLAGGLELVPEQNFPKKDDERIPPYEAGEQAMRNYLAWEVQLMDIPTDKHTS
jgi:rhodanese-related sulfurtransferase